VDVEGHVVRSWIAALNGGFDQWLGRRGRRIGGNGRRHISPSFVVFMAGAKKFSEANWICRIGATQGD
jgi:hypothetical protein